MTDDLRPRKSDVAPALPHLQDGEVDVQKVWTLVRGFKVRKTGRGQFFVESRSDPENSVYLLDTETSECSCHPFSKRGYCLHTTLLAPHLTKL